MAKSKLYSRFTPEDIERMITMKNSGKSIYQIAAALGRTYQSVASKLRDIKCGKITYLTDKNEVKEADVDLNAGKKKETKLPFFSQDDFNDIAEFVIPDNAEVVEEKVVDEEEADVSVEEVKEPKAEVKVVKEIVRVPFTLDDFPIDDIFQYLYDQGYNVDEWNIEKVQRQKYDFKNKKKGK